MGCDIHFFSEVKLADGQWYCYGSPDLSRNYALFGKMAGVRCPANIMPIAEPRGLPDDCSVVVRWASDDYGEDGHSHSYLTASEIAELEDWWREKYKDAPGMRAHFPEIEWGYLNGNSWGGFMRWPSEAPDGLMDVRFVFWFDN